MLSVTCRALELGPEWPNCANAGQGFVLFDASLRAPSRKCLFWSVLNRQREVARALQPLDHGRRLYVRVHGSFGLTRQRRQARGRDPLANFRVLAASSPECFTRCQTAIVSRRSCHGLEQEFRRCAVHERSTRIVTGFDARTHPARARHDATSVEVWWAGECAGAFLERGEWRVQVAYGSGVHHAHG